MRDARARLDREAERPRLVAVKNLWTALPVPGRHGSSWEVRSVEAFVELADGGLPTVIPYPLAYHLNRLDAETIAHAMNVAEVDPRALREHEIEHEREDHVARGCWWCARLNEESAR